jgi:hypothetical protein
LIAAPIGTALALALILAAILAAILATGPIGLVGGHDRDRQGERKGGRQGPWGRPNDRLLGHGSQAPSKNRDVHGQSDGSDRNPQDCTQCR